MAIAFRSVGTPLRTDVSVTGAAQSVPLPPGHASGDLILLYIITDSTSSTPDPAGWTRLFFVSVGNSTASPYTPRMWVKVFYRIDNGSLGSSVPLSFSTEDWPAGNPYVLARTVAYTGCDPVRPVETARANGTLDAVTSFTASQITTTSAGDWLLTFQCASTDAPAATFTDSVAGDVKRFDGNDGFDELAMALFDSGGPLSAGVQPQRTITFSRESTYGALAVSIALKPPAGSTAATAVPDEGDVAATAYSPAVQVENGPWDLCGEGMPAYGLAVDWAGDGSFTDPSETGDTYAADTFGRTVTGGWGSADTGQPWTVGYTPSEHSVTSGTGVHSVASVGTSRWGLVPSPSPDTDAAVDFKTSAVAVGGHQYVYLQARSVDNANFYFARVQLTTSQQVVLALRKLVGGTETQLTTYTTGLTHTAGTWYTVRMRAVGPTLWAKVWATGTAEPDWQTTADDTDLSDAASIGVRSLLGGGNTNTLPVLFTYDNLRVFQPLDGDDVTRDLISDVSIVYGRDQERQFSPGSVGSASFSLNNISRRYSPDNAESPLNGNLDPARPARIQVAWNGQTFPLFKGRIDDYTVKTDFGDRTVDLTFLDSLSELSGTDVYTGVLSAMRTGELMHVILDEVGWTGGRDIDPGATVVKFWWLDGTDALTAINDLVKSEGPPAVAYAAPDGTFVFRDRHHRILRQNSLVPQAVLHAGALGDCDPSTVPAGALSVARPFTYAHGWKDIVNSVTFDVAERAPAGEITQVWQDTTTYTLAIGESVDLNVSSSDPFFDAVDPVVGTDIVYTGSGVVRAVLSRPSGASAKLSLRAVGGPVVITSCQVRARLLAVQQTVRVSLKDSESMAQHGTRTYPDNAPWASARDAEAIATRLLLYYAQRRPTVQIRLVSSDPAHYVQVLQRTVSDRVTVVNDEMRLDSDFFVERVSHTIQRTGDTGRPPVHAVVLGCEKDLEVAVNPFTFDKRGAGFDAGTFDPWRPDDAAGVFLFDDPVQGRFDTGEFGT